jgi:hypothetical protein
LPGLADWVGQLRSPAEPVVLVRRLVPARVAQRGPLPRLTLPTPVTELLRNTSGPYQVCL